MNIKEPSRVFVMVLLLAAAAWAQAVPYPSDLVGDWSGTLRIGEETAPLEFELRDQGGKLGGALREALRPQECFTPAQALSILRDVCAALEAAHRRQLVHRDLKPENIFLVRGERGDIKAQVALISASF